MIDTDLLEPADVLLAEMVDVDNGARFETYTTPGERGTRQIKANAAARLVQQADTIMVISYANCGHDERQVHEPKVVHVPENEIITVERRPRRGVTHSTVRAG